MPEPSRRGARRAAQAAAELSRRHVRVYSRPLEYGVVKSIQPLSVELIEGAEGTNTLVLDESGLTLSASVRRYDLDHLLKKGDTLALIQLSSEDFVALEVIVASEVTRGVDTWTIDAGDLEIPVVGHTDPDGGGGSAGHITLSVLFKLRVRDELGDVVGWIPVFEPGLLPGAEPEEPGPA